METRFLHAWLECSMHFEQGKRSVKHNKKEIFIRFALDFFSPNTISLICFSVFILFLFFFFYFQSIRNNELRRRHAHESTILIYSNYRAIIDAILLTTMKSQPQNVSLPYTTNKQQTTLFTNTRAALQNIHGPATALYLRPSPHGLSHTKTSYLDTVFPDVSANPQTLYYK